MTTNNNDQSLIKKVGGIERAKEIVEGAPESNFPVKWGLGFKTYFRQVGYFVEQWFEGKWQTRYSDNWVDLESLRTAIAKHDRTTKYDWSKVPELIVWIATDEDGLTFGYPNQPYQETFLGRGRWNNDRFIPLFMSKFQFSGDWTQSLEQRPKDITDSCADIRNHVSPSTLVWDLAGGEDWTVEVKG